MPPAVHQSLASFFSRLFPRTRDLEIHVDSSADESNVYVDVSLRHGGAAYRIENFAKIPARIQVGDRHFRISHKNRQTLVQLANLDPRFDPQKGFVFPEKDAPEILSYLRPKASVEFSKASKGIHVDERPLEYEHAVSQVKDELDISTSFLSPDSLLRIETPQDAKFVDGSKYVHAPSGYFKKPQENKLKSLTGDIGRIRLRGDQIPFFLLQDLKRIQAEPRSRVSNDVQSQRVVTQQFQPQVSLQVDGPWLWFDVRYHADRFNVDYQEVAKLDPSRQFIRRDEAWIQIDKRTHNRVAGQIEEIPEIETVEDRFRTRTYHYDEVQSLLEQVASLDISEASAQFRKSLEDFSQIEEHPQASTSRTASRKHFQYKSGIMEQGISPTFSALS